MAGAVREKPFTLCSGESVESDNVVRWDGERLYVEQDVYQDGQLVHRKYRRTVTEPVARALAALLAESAS